MPELNADYIKNLIGSPEAADPIIQAAWDRAAAEIAAVDSNHVTSELMQGLQDDITCHLLLASAVGQPQEVSAGSFTEKRNFMNADKSGWEATSFGARANSTLLGQLEKANKSAISIPREDEASDRDTTSRGVYSHNYNSGPRGLLS